MQTHAKGNSSMDIVYFSHGGGPMPLLDDPGHKKMVDFMKNLPSTLSKPQTVIVISAHWEEQIPTTIGGEDPGLLYDYYGFPKETYEIKYPVKGNPDLAKRIQRKFEIDGIDAKVDLVRKYDHGLYIPLILMYPDADITSIQISLKKNLNPKEHIEIGKTLRNIDFVDDTLIVGSGFSFHNMREFRFDNENVPDSKNDAFQDWLIDVCINNNYSQSERENFLINWEKAPNARYCHPREEHLLPLHVCLGLANKEAEKIFDDYILGKRAVAFKW